MSDDKKMTWDAISTAAESIEIDPCVLHAIYVVETGGKDPFLPDGRPKILFEAHVFWRELSKRGINPRPLLSTNSDILLPPEKNNAFNRKQLYKGGKLEYVRLDKAIAIDKDSALCSASWGAFQIMGFNYEICDYENVGEFVTDMETSTTSQLTAVCKFLQGKNLGQAMQDLDWNRIAYIYNGADYKSNNYHIKLEEAYDACLDEE